MAWRQGQSYSEDLRARVLAAVDGGMAARAAAKLFRVSVSYIYKALIRRRRTGEANASGRRGHRPRKLSPAQEAALAEHIAAHSDITLAALQIWLLEEHGVRLSNGAMWAAVRRLGRSTAYSADRIVSMHLKNIVQQLQVKLVVLDDQNSFRF